ncbi:hypothetical protein GALMADRAFT_67262 [Galerina marginata CBS 339.88]|uniref:Uncharacterized protein n=1 Tax=Galerina marginata (strain CBS 339.88) TaxID=685588 RepID=A0A067T2J6_GALM3|nr:hypothetical protein GALMADRAFT_67262 [Galerina marginata CBS 339.88]
MLEKDYKTLKEESNESISLLQARIKALIEAQKNLTYRRVILWKRCRRLEAAKRRLKRRMHERSKSHPNTFRMMEKGCYTAAARSLARLLVSTGTAEAKVGGALVEIGDALGVKVNRRVNRRSVQRFILEKGVAADIQLVYEIINSAKITYSSDSTSHRHIEYECRTIALQVVDYSDPDAKLEWKSRTLGIGTSINHASQTQVDGLKQRLRELGEVFNNSPLAKRKGLHFKPDDFAFRLIGTTGDHAADQKKSHEILRIWRLEVILMRLGEEALMGMDVGRCLATLIAMKAKQVESYGGQQKWDALSADEKAGADAQIIRDIGKQVFDALPQDHQERLTRFIRTGCCMHKDLNCVKGGAKAMAEMWTNLKKTPPRLLANKDNAAVLANRSSGTEPTAAEKRAEEVSKRGGVHATTLGGMIFRNKDTKKGQQDTYVWYMEKHIGHRVPYPDVSNTRYGSHGEAAAVILVYLSLFLSFMEAIRDAKDRPGETNIEKNFAAALKDIPTLTELCVLALYNIAVSRPFMQHVRTHENLLNLREFFEKKAAFLQSIVDKPALWTGDDVSHETGHLDGAEWDEWSLTVLAAIKGLKAQLPDLDEAVIAFVTGARETFVERFSDEFKEGGDIDKMTETELNTLYFSSTNDLNEGGLGSWRRGQARRPAETLLKFNASFMATRNETESFMTHKLTEEEDQIYLMRTARKRDESGHQNALKVAQIRADEEKIAENRKKEAQGKEKREKQANILMQAVKDLALTDVDIDKLKVDPLILQLECHREIEKLRLAAVNVDSVNGDSETAVEKIPLKSHMKNKSQRVPELKKAVIRFHARGETKETAYNLLSRALETIKSTGGDHLYESDNDDL